MDDERRRGEESIVDGREATGDSSQQTQHPCEPGTPPTQALRRSIVLHNNGSLISSSSPRSPSPPWIRLKSWQCRRESRVNKSDSLRGGMVEVCELNEVEGLKDDEEVVSRRRSKASKLVVF